MKLNRNLKTVGQRLGNFVKRITKFITFELFKVQKFTKWQQYNFRVRSKANKNVSIKVRLSIDRNNVFELNTGFSINPKDWSDNNRTTQTNKSRKQNII